MKITNLKQMRTIFILFIFLFVFTSCKKADTITEKTLQIPVNVIATKKEKQTIYSSYRGFVVAKDVKKLSFEQPGKIKSILVDKGQQINKGDHLAVLDTYYTQMALDNANQNTIISQKGVEQLQTGANRIQLGIESEKINLEKAIVALDGEKINLNKSLSGIQAEKLNLNKLKNSYENQLSTLQLNYNDTLDKYQKTELLYQSGIVSETEYTNAKLALDTITINIENVKSSYSNDVDLQNKSIQIMEDNYQLQEINIQAVSKNIELQKIKVQDLQKQLEGVHAQIGSAEAQSAQSQIGVRQYEKQVNDGILVSPINGFILDILIKSGEEAGAGYPVIVIKSDNQVINFGIPVEDYKYAKLGMIVQLESSDNHFSGKVTSIGQYPDENTRTYEIEITPEKQDLLVGSIINIGIPIEESQSILLPLSSILTIDGVNYVYIAEKDEQDNLIARKKEVILGEPLESQVICGNLEEGQKVITQGIKFIKEGDKVTLDMTTEEYNEK